MWIMLLALVTLGLALLAPQESGAPPRLAVGEGVEAEVLATAPKVHTPTLDANYTSQPTVGFECRVAVEESGPYRIELRSYDFDAYLVLRDGGGELLAEDDDGLISTHARLVVELEEGEEYRLTACALHGSFGRFRLELAAGAPDPVSPIERTRLDLEEARAALAYAELTHGPEHLLTAVQMHGLASRLYSAGDFAEALQLYERAFAIREAQLGLEHTLTGESLNNVAALASSMGDYKRARPLYEQALAQDFGARGAQIEEIVTMDDSGLARSARPAARGASAALLRR